MARCRLNITIAGTASSMRGRGNSGDDGERVEQRMLGPADGGGNGGGGGLG